MTFSRIAGFMSVCLALNLETLKKNPKKSGKISALNCKLAIKDIPIGYCYKLPKLTVLVSFNFSNESCKIYSVCGTGY